MRLATTYGQQGQRSRHREDSLRIRNLVDEGVVVRDPSARELATGPGDRRRMIPKPRIRSAGECDHPLKGRPGSCRLLVEDYAEPSLRDEQVGNTRGPITGPDTPDGDRIGQRCRKEPRIRASIALRLQGGDRNRQGTGTGTGTGRDDAITRGSVITVTSPPWSRSIVPRAPSPPSSSLITD